jgi:hypothetical protein
LTVGWNGPIIHSPTQFKTITIIQKPVGLLEDAGTNNSSTISDLKVAEFVLVWLSVQAGNHNPSTRRKIFKTCVSSKDARGENLLVPRTNWLDTASSRFDNPRGYWKLAAGMIGIPKEFLPKETDQAK